MFDQEKFIEKIAAVKPGVHDMNTDELTAIVNTGGGALEASFIAFRFGFLKGQRAERAEQRKREAGKGRSVASIRGIASNAKTLDFDLWPSVLEVKQATDIFLCYVNQRAELTGLSPQDPAYMSNDTLMRCAIAEVWRLGKIYQRNKERERLA